MIEKIREIELVLWDLKNNKGELPSDNKIAKAVYKITRLDEGKVEEKISNFEMWAGYKNLRIKLSKAICSNQDKLTKE